MKQWVLITGGSSGIGFELAKIFAARDYSLVLIARDEVRLQHVSEELSATGATIKILTKDLSERNVPAEIFSELQRENIFVSVLVNNAGFGRQGAFADTSLPEMSDMIEVNVTSLIQLTHFFVKPMLARGEGRILNVASTAAFQPGPFMATYYATKAFVFSFSYALADELEGTDVTVSALCPGPTQTPFYKRAGRFHSKEALKFWMMSADDVAQIGFRGLMRGQRIIIPGFVNKLGFMFAKWLPTKIPTKVARRIISGG